MLENNSPSRTFLGIRFVLFGFDPLDENKARLKLIEGGGVDEYQYSQDCTHVIVDKIVYDDPICVIARNDGKTLVTGLWIDHSVDIGMPVDATSIMYRPLKDLNGIPGAKNLIMCLTGYQRQDRDDIMTMVGLMGAQFSKPLVANKVTHLICYKFEGEKYELANKLKRIKLVNHRWLEDCLKEWELIPEDNYSKSGYELEMMEVEAKDSEDDAETGATSKKQSSCKNANKSPQMLKMGTPEGSELTKSSGKMPKTSLSSIEPQSLSNFVNSKDVMATPGKKNKSNPVLGFDAICMSANPGSLDAGSLKDAISVDLPEQQERTPNSLKVCNDLGSAPRTVIRPSNTDAKSCRSYSRKTAHKSPSSIFSGDSGNVRKSKVDLGEPSSTSYAKEFEYAEEFLHSPAEMPLRGSELPSEDPSSSKKRKIDASFPSSKSRKSPDAQSRILSSPSVSCKPDGLASAFLVDGLPKIDHHSLNATHDCSMHDARNSPANDSTAKSAKLIKKSFAGDPSNTSLEGKKNEQADKKKLRTCPGKTLIGGLDGDELESEDSEHMAAKTVVQHIQLQDKGVALACDKSSETEKSETNSTTGKLQVANENSSAKPIKKMMVTKKTLGSRSKLKSNANQKCSIYDNIVAAQNDPASILAGVEGADAASTLAVGKEGADPEKDRSANDLEKLPLTVNVAAMEERDTNIDSRSDLKNRTDMDDETEAPDENDECVNLLSEERNEVMDLSHKTNDETIKKSEEVVPGTINSAFSIHRDTKKGKNVAQEQKKDEPVLEKNGENGNKRRGKKQSSGRIKTKTAKRVSQAQSEVLDKEETGNGGNTKEKENNEPSSQRQAKDQALSSMKSENSRKVEKENKPVQKHQNSNHSKGQMGKKPVKSNKLPMKIDTSESNCNRTKVREIPRQMKAEPVCFILSGHRLQRKEFQQVIRRLKGRFCRDSHNWSYQATHFIAPDIRRTEKLFAAAASGRWILKTDYLTACSQAGKFLAEEPYEWHKSGLSEDGAINLEGPRKWRHLRERTGHGAFYGMRIVIYGECITPPLDTLKRVVKAGDGTILATSPPYTRFLASGVDYAIVSAGMPRVDIWVQEFLKHEIPCVLADYLVEYVCKPGYSLERHVLYNTNAWAEKSFANLLKKSEEVVDELTPSDDCSSNDTACQVCGSHDREEVMLICGDESGSVGCGVGMHIDCCDPPLSDIPVEDWFCPNCSKIKESIKHPKKKTKRSSSKTNN